LCRADRQAIRHPATTPMIPTGRAPGSRRRCRRPAPGFVGASAPTWLSSGVGTASMVCTTSLDSTRSPVSVVRRSVGPHPTGVARDPAVDSQRRHNDRVPGVRRAGIDLSWTERCESALTLTHVARTRNDQAQRPPRSRSRGSESAADYRRRLLAERAGFLAGTIYLFENRDPEGALLDFRPSPFSDVEMAGRFDKKFKRRLRSLFADLKNEGLVTEDDLTLFYWPQTGEARLRLAQRLDHIGQAARPGA
jgi:hypothetical protein